VASRPTTLQPAVSQATKNSDEANDTDNLLESTMAAKKYIQKHSLIIHSVLLTLEALCYAILHTSQVAKLPQTTQQVLRAIATLMKQIEKDTDCECYSQAIVAGVQDGLQPIINQLRSTATSLEADIQMLHSQLNDLDSSALKKIANTIETTAARVETFSATLVNTTSSYRDALLHSAKSAPTSSPLLDPQVTQRVLLQS
jgi:methyl-accepting chemotaxis protein